MAASGTIANAGRDVSLREKAVTSTRYWPFMSGWSVVSDHWPVLLATVLPARVSSVGFPAGPTARRMIEPGAAVPLNSG